MIYSFDARHEHINEMLRVVEESLPGLEERVKYQAIAANMLLSQINNFNNE